MADQKLKKAQIEINRSMCKECGICVALCPKKVYDLDFKGAPQATRVGDCILCMMCELRCPDFAITVLEVE